MQKECILGLGADGLRSWNFLWNLSGIGILVQLWRYADYLGRIFHFKKKIGVITLSGGEYDDVRILDKE